MAMVSFLKKKCVIKDSHGQEIVKEKMRGNNLCVNLNNLSKHTYSASDSKINMWHKRLRHFDLKH